MWRAVVAGRFLLGKHALRLLSALAGGVLVLSGCTTNIEDIGPEVPKVPVQRVDAIAARVPAPIAQSGALAVGVNVPYQPNEYRDRNGNIVGFDVDLMNAVTAVLGIRADYIESAFEKIIPAVQAGTYHVGMSSITDTREREKQVDLITYFAAGVQWAQRTGQPIDPLNACGKRVAVQATTVEHIEEVPAKSAQCVAEGNPPIVIQAFDEQSAATNALVLGQVDGMSADSPVTAYAIRLTEGKIEPAGPVFDAQPYGWAVATGSPLGPLLRDALQHLIDNGIYRQIAENWGVQEGAISTSVINGARS
ncbi:ABC transporter substrate-binding protein [Nocardia donostiensis]|uniref:ABC transporter substrate-binding protein n=1 Tax=Nocardia donostiensis TaxID=1538463 RepID=A0A1W0ASM4_9NOCA|nr:ABC transporter substrate-binding protein [Nocardia donostiensis]ONM46895.1 ABC transporter substrate-binding protein [Nocardia donostiensis]OQS13244.1 ABC transporter substrate-binding protein [Nocardia donostiensis]OQS19154.1 ABC transporter substrate-binding protein [Nocardia donostiensis]